MDGDGWIFGAAVMVLLIVLAVIAVVWLLRNQASGAGSGRSTAEGGSARDLLDRRLVSGEINEGEYRRLRSALSDTPTEPASTPATPATADAAVGRTIRGPASPGRGRGTAPARPSALSLETAGLRFARGSERAANRT
jgi:hypothetical protein